MGHVVVGDCGNFDHLELCNVHLKHSTQVFQHFAPIEMRVRWLGLDSTTSCLAAQHLSHKATTAGSAPDGNNH